MMADAMKLIKDRVKNPPAIFIDIPAGITPEKMSNIYIACEYIKDGFAFDKKYKYKKMRFDSPPIWVFINQMPDLELLTLDKWVFHHIIDNELIKVSSDKFIQ